jgi:predicted ABC-type ATPase
LQDALEVDEFVNADAIALGLSAFRPEAAAVAAGRVMLERLAALAAARRDFAFETTLAGQGLLPRIERMRSGGYHVHLAFLSLPSVDLAYARVDDRVRRGGHDVPAGVVARRFRAGLRNLFGPYLAKVDTWQVLDNSGSQGPRVVGRRRFGVDYEILDAEAWANLRQQAR